ncbi:MAG: PhzF family phenazine biosynthesis protein [Acidobacteriaceae bacterium]|nr:PhzF family phenazine biosynthesis protein [Acidobacteriaceae bacterium]
MHTSETALNINTSRRTFLQTGTASGVFAASGLIKSAMQSKPGDGRRRFHVVQVDVFTLRRLEGKPLAVFTDARGLTDSEMQDLARETNLQETTFVFPRDATTEREHGIKVRIFWPSEEIPFGGHPTLGTAMVLRKMRLASQKSGSTAGDDFARITLDLKVGKVPVDFRTDKFANVFGEMHQVDPIFGPVHDQGKIADLLDLSPSDISTDAPIQTVSTGLPFIIVPIKTASILQQLKLAPQKAYDYVNRQNLPELDFYYVTRDTGDAEIGLRARGIYSSPGEDPATGSPAGCTAAWMVRCGVAQPNEVVHILQGVEIKRPSHLYVRASKFDQTVKNVRVGGHAVQIMEGIVHL